MQGASRKEPPGGRRQLLLVFVFMFVFAFLFASCSTQDRVHPPTQKFIEPAAPFFSFGSPSEIEQPGAYKAISTYTVDTRHNVYIADIENKKIDKYDKDGRFLLSFGGLNHDAIRYPGWIDITAVDPAGNLIAYSNTARKFLFFSPDALRFKEIPAGKEFLLMAAAASAAKTGFAVKKIKFDPSGNMFLLVYLKDRAYRLIKYDLNSRRITLIHTDPQGQRPAMFFFPPDFDFAPDPSNSQPPDVYITHTREYRIYRYTSSGRFVSAFFKPTPQGQLEVNEIDFNYLSEAGKVRQIPDFSRQLKSLEDSKTRFPAVFGVHVDGDRVYVWTSRQNPEKKYLLDIYDSNFNYIGTTAYYNSLGSNLAVIMDKNLYLPDLGTEDMGIKSYTGRLSIFNIPSRIDVYRL